MTAGEFLRGHRGAAGKKFDSRLNPDYLTLTIDDVGVTKIMSEPKKRIFIGLIVFTVLLITAVTVGLYLIPYIGLKNIHPLAPKIVCFTMGAVARRS